MSDIIYKYGNVDFESVDFYSPLFNAVIEIDGNQHINNDEQNIKDHNRNKVLELNGVDIIRIKTSEINNINIVKQKLNKLKYNLDYKNSVVFSNKLSECDLYYMSIMRIEILLLSLYQYNYLKLTDNQIALNIYSKENIKKEIFETAYFDFMSWLKNLSVLQNQKFVIPNLHINIVNSEKELSILKNGINIAIFLKDVYSQTNYSNIIYIKNDYFLYEENLIPTIENNSTKSSYRYKKNYFKVSNCNITYKITKEGHSEALIYILKNVSNIYNDFRANQLDIIIECLNKTSVIGILPTGAGKSLCYQLVALLIPSITLVVSPLQLLMIDQYNSIKAKLGITNIIYISADTKENISVLENNQALICIISPERFFSEKFTSLLSSKRISVGFVVIDEAHCLSEWGHDFRTSYLCLSHNLNRFLPNNTYLMALTATASNRVFEDIDCEFQNFKHKKTRSIYADCMKRDNLTIIVLETKDKYKELIDNIYPTLVGVNKDKTLIFTKTKYSYYAPHASACITLTEAIKSEYDKKIDCNLIDYYAGGDDDNNQDKIKKLNQFKNGNKLVFFATKAFGMGVDIPDIRKTIHYGLPSSLEGLYQQVGRAGRDGKPSKCYVYFTKEREETLNLYFKIPPIPVSVMENHLNMLNELRTNFYFIENSNLDIDIEKEVCIRLLEGIKRINKKGKTDISCSIIKDSILRSVNDTHLNKIFEKYGSVKNIIEKGLYRLFLLGEINMWGVVYAQNLNDPIFNHLQVTSLSEEEKLAKLKYHIEKYESKFKFEDGNSFDNRLKFLIRWTYDNFLQERIQSMKTLYEECVHFTTSERFINFIDEYFSNDPIYTQLISKGVELKKWIRALEEYPEKTKDRIARLLESYDKITPLNYVSGITRLRVNDFEHSDGRRRLCMALEEIKEYSDEDRMYLFFNTYKYLTKDKQNTFVECWLNYCKEDAQKIYESTQNECCEQFLIINFVNDLLKIGEKIDDRL